jgi:hypothetical protein
MTDTKLQKELEMLRNEVNNIAVGNDEAREKLNLLISDIEKKLEGRADEAHDNNLLQGIKDAIGQFESEHPRATAILNDIMITLSNMGI